MHNHIYASETCATIYIRKKSNSYMDAPMTSIDPGTEPVAEHLQRLVDARPALRLRGTMIRCRGARVVLPWQVPGSQHLARWWAFLFCGQVVSLHVSTSRDVVNIFKPPKTGWTPSVRVWCMPVLRHCMEID